MMPRFALLMIVLALGACVAAMPVPPATTAAGEVDYHCKVDADCAVKDVGNCCGYFPACVHRDSAVDPERVRAACLKNGESSICGFADISACRCEQNVCSAVEPAIP